MTWRHHDLINHIYDIPFANKSGPASNQHTKCFRQSINYAENMTNVIFDRKSTDGILIGNNFQ